MGRMLSKMNLISVVQQLPKEDIETIQGYVEMIEQECEELNKQLEEVEEMHKDMARYALDNEAKIDMLNNQQKEFVSYLKKTIEELESDDFDDEEMKGYLVQRIDTFKEILSKYKSIIGGRDGN